MRSWHLPAHAQFLSQPHANFSGATVFVAAFFTGAFFVVVATVFLVTVFFGAVFLTAVFFAGLFAMFPSFCFCMTFLFY
jgi:hypothetical protein